MDKKYDIKFTTQHTSRTINVMLEGFHKLVANRLVIKEMIQCRIFDSGRKVHCIHALNAGV